LSSFCFCFLFPMPSYLLNFALLYFCTSAFPFLIIIPLPCRSLLPFHSISSLFALFPFASPNLRWVRCIDPLTLVSPQRANSPQPSPPPRRPRSALHRTPNTILSSPTLILTHHHQAQFALNEPSCRPGFSF